MKSIPQRSRAVNRLTPESERRCRGILARTIKRVMTRVNAYKSHFMSKGVTWAELRSEKMKVQSACRRVIQAMDEIEAGHWPSIWDSDSRHRTARVKRSTQE